VPLSQALPLPPAGPSPSPPPPLSVPGPVSVSDSDSRTFLASASPLPTPLAGAAPSLQCPPPAGVLEAPRPDRHSLSDLHTRDRDRDIDRDRDRDRDGERDSCGAKEDEDEDEEGVVHEDAALLQFEAAARRHFDPPPPLPRGGSSGGRGEGTVPAPEVQEERGLRVGREQGASRAVTAGRDVEAEEEEEERGDMHYSAIDDEEEVAEEEEEANSKQRGRQQHKPAAEKPQPYVHNLHSQRSLDEIQDPDSAPLRSTFPIPDTPLSTPVDEAVHLSSQGRAFSSSASTDSRDGEGGGVLTAPSISSSSSSSSSLPSSPVLSSPASESGRGQRGYPLQEDTRIQAAPEAEAEAEVMDVGGVQELTREQQFPLPPSSPLLSPPLQRPSAPGAEEASASASASMSASMSVSMSTSIQIQSTFRRLMRLEQQQIHEQWRAKQVSCAVLCAWNIHG
jgi:hypothetical protein